MRIINCEQGSEEWHQARAGVITASMFETVCVKLKNGSYSKAAEDYAFKLAIERISGELLQEDKFETFEMRRGRELEPVARLKHEKEKGILVEQVGFALTDCGRFGASVDGIIIDGVSDSGICEYKCFISPQRIRNILLETNKDEIPEELMWQVQGGLWVTGKDYAHFVLYCPALKNIGKDLTIKGVNRDANFISQMVQKLEEFDQLVCKNIELLKEAA